ncbi:ATP phosphoribosyltransferase regulatory subunit [Peptococcus simiae]|uniref:ATP phosphoribosyltransferase regulatory subunit n=1 Tax=Peptococcus simiae TaxID=1643805 RepID=A0ABW9GYG9_9FIRM
MKMAGLTPEGSGDVLMPQAAREYRVAGDLRRLFGRYGYEEVRTPGLEYYDVFTDKKRYFPQENMVKSIDRHGRLTVVRPDATVPIARLVASKLSGKALPLRLFYDEMIFRNSSTLQGFSNEMHQCGVELLGSRAYRADAEMIALSCAALKATGLTSYRLELSHVGVVEALIRALAVDEDLADQIRTSLEEKNFSRLRDLLAPYGQGPVVEAFLALPGLFGDYAILDKARALLVPASPEVGPILDELARRYALAQSLCREDHIMLDLSLTNQADYYTGLVFRGYVGGSGEAVLSGGRYDSLLETFNYPIPAIGFGVRVDLIAQVLNRRRRPETEPFYLLYAGPEDLPAALSWRADRSDRLVLAMADRVEDLEEEAARLGARGIIIYKDGDIHWQED